MKAKKHFTIWRCASPRPGKGYAVWKFAEPISVLTALLAYMLLLAATGFALDSAVYITAGILLASAAAVTVYIARAAAYCHSRCFVFTEGRLYIYAYNKLSPSGKLRDEERPYLKLLSSALDTGRNIDAMTESGVIEHLLEGTESFGCYAVPLSRVYSVRKLFGIYRISCACGAQAEIKFILRILPCWNDTKALIKRFRDIKKCIQ